MAGLLQVASLYGAAGGISDLIIASAAIKNHCSALEKCLTIEIVQNDHEFLDGIDLALLDHLQQDASLSNLDLARRIHVSPPTCLRRVRRLHDAGLIERQIAILNSDRLGNLLGHGLEAVVEITLERQGAEELDAFERRVIADSAVTQCYRVSPGPDFILNVRAADMPGYLALAQRLFTSDANVRNVKAFFVVNRAKFKPHVPLGRGGPA